SLEDAMKLMRDNEVSSVGVEPNKEGQWGILTRRDVVNKIIRGKKSATDIKVSTIAKHPVIMTSQDTHLHEAVDTMSSNNISRLLVQQGEEVVGIVTETDIFQTLEQFGQVPE